MPTFETPAPSFEDVWRMFQETDRKFQETDLKFKETDLKFQETDRRFKETDLKFKETDRRQKETDRMIRQMSKQLGEHGNRLGEFVQELVRPAVVRLFRSRGWPVHRVMPNVVAYEDDGRFAMEIDLLVLNGQTAIAVECKSKLSSEAIDEHVARLQCFKRYFPEMSACHLLGAVAGMVVPPETARYAEKLGLYVLRQSGEAVEIGNAADFEPKVW